MEKLAKTDGLARWAMRNREFFFSSMGYLYMVIALVNVLVYPGNIIPLNRIFLFLFTVAGMACLMIAYWGKIEGGMYESTASPLNPSTGEVEESIITKRSRVVGPDTIVSLPDTCLFESIQINTNPGFIYIMQRSDGIYKFGKTDNPYRRINEHIRAYEQDFRLVKRFSVPDMKVMERVALSMTAEYRFIEPGRDELRNMTDDQLEEFIEQFKEICKALVDS